VGLARRHGIAAKSLEEGSARERRVHWQHAGARTDRRRAAVYRTAGARAGWCTAFIGVRGSWTGRGSAGRREDHRTASYVVG
jgi:hypothetical protein